MPSVQMMITYKSSPQGLYVKGLLLIIINPMPHLVNLSRHLSTPSHAAPRSESPRHSIYHARHHQPVIFLAALQQTTKDLPVSL